MERIEDWLTTIDHTIEYIKGERSMVKEEFFNPDYDPAQQTAYEKEIQHKYGNEELKQSQQRWGGYTDIKRREIMAEGSQITQAIFEQMPKGFDHPDVQTLMEQYHHYMNYFYDCSLDVFEGLGQMYHEDPRFRVLYEAKHPDFPVFMMNAMKYYADQRRKEFLQ
jgi:hypothetical protein